MQPRLLPVLALAMAAAPGFAQSPLATTPATQVQTASALDSWQAAHGSEWRTTIDPQTGFARFLFGGHTEYVSSSVTDADLVDLARVHIGEAYSLFGIDPAGLVLDEVVFLPLGMVGTTDKITVQFRQVKGGVNVERGLVSALFDLSGRLLSLDTVGLPDALLPASTAPARDAANAVSFATEAFAEQTGLEAIDIDVLGLSIVQEEVDSSRRGTLAWRIRVGNEVQGAEPKASILSIAAAGEARVVKSENQIHNFDVGGTVSTLATPGLGAPNSSNPATLAPAGYMRVSGPGGATTFTDAFGNFNLVGVTGPINVRFEYVGTYNDVRNSNGGDYLVTIPLADGLGNTALLNPTGADKITAQANAFVNINLMRDWTRSINPADSKSDFVATANVNISSACNAFYNGASTNYFLPGSGCFNTSYSTVIWHEMGHWMNDQYSSGNGSDGFGEGNADVFAMYQADSSIVALDFFGFGTNIRDGENTKQFCGDSNPGCFGEVHADGEVLMGALWKVRKRLNNTLGNAQGDALSNLLFNSWMNAYNDTQIKTIIETHWLTLDDNDGNITNGTPHFGDINAGFMDQGFPGVQLDSVNITSVMGPGTTPDQAGPYGVSAVITPVGATTVAGATLFYRVSGGAAISVPMTTASNDRYFATIPGQTSPNKVEWWVQGTNSIGQSEFFPVGAPGVTNSFDIGALKLTFFDDFETAGDNGWSHAAVQFGDDWEHGTPQGLAGDPAAAFSGANVWGNDLGFPGNDGKYSGFAANFLRSPQIDLAGSIGATLVYQRWLRVDTSSQDKAEIRINGTPVWVNSASGSTLDTSWNAQTLDISAFDGQVVELEWRLTPNGILHFGGWNIDDVGIKTLQPSATVGLPTYFGSASPGSTTPTIDTAGQPAAIGNADFVAKVKGAPSETAVFLGFGFAQINVPLLGVTQLVLPASIFTGQTDLFGQYEESVPVPNDPALVGFTVFFQALVVDPGGPQGFSATDGMQLVIVP